MIDFSEILYRIKTLPLVSRVILFSLAGLLVTGLLLWSMSDVLFPPPYHPVVRPGPTVTPVQLQVSPLLFGTNLVLHDANDQVLTSAPTRSLLQQLHMQIIRMRMRPSLPETTAIQAAQTIKNLGAVPLVVLLAGTDATTLTTDARTINDINKIFGNSIVYYEFGSEEDLLGTSADSYTASWNAVVPQLKQLASQAHFVGPVTYRYDQAYLATFLKGAQPRPDEVSWHEYTCSAADAKDICLAHISNWTTHITNARSVMTNTFGKVLPIMITEWNYAPDSASSPNALDTKSSDSQFLTTWTQHALQTLAANHVFASMQYFCTGAVPLVANNATLAPEGLVFQAQYQQLVASNQPVATNPTQQATSTVTDAATATPVVQLAPTPSAIAQNTPSPGSTAQPTPTPTPTLAPSASPTAQPTPTPPTSPDMTTPTPTSTPSDMATPTSTTPGMTMTTPTSTPADPQNLYTTVTSVSPAYTTSLASQDGGKWDTGSFNGGGSCGFVGGTYQIAVPQSGFAGVCIARGTSISNFAFQVQMTIVAGDGGGIVFRGSDQQMYRFRVSSDGSYDLMNQTQVLTAGSSNAIKTGLNQANQLTVIAKGQQIYIYANQQFLTSINDSASSSGRLGLFAVNFTKSTNVAFSNVQVWEVQ